MNLALAIYLEARYTIYAEAAGKYARFRSAWLSPSHIKTCLQDFERMNAA